jgi:outer membrane protein OmpA-like peptidoglycan-associated protein
MSGSGLLGTRTARLLAAAAPALLLGACASAGSKVTLLEGEPGSAVGAVAVLDAKSETEVGQLTVANTTAQVGGRAVSARPTDPAAYGDLLAVVPPPPRQFRLYFIEGGTTLTEASRPTFELLKSLVQPGSFVQIVGYTDTVGSEADNQKLSERRAEEIKTALVRMGLPVQDARTTGRGKHDLAKPTADNVAEPLNRRVEVVLR